MGIKYINAKRLRSVLIGGAKWLQKYEAYLNELNVYPVPDGDTGTNMCMTVQTMISEIEENTNDKTSMEDLSLVVEEAVLIGARGNSGTILSQIINGFLKGIGGKKRLVPADITIALKEAKELAYNVVSNPVEGTMLTVIRRIYERSEEIKDYEFFNEYIDELVIAANKAVEETPELLEKLKEANVVDSGGKGLFYFFEGMGKVLTEIDLITKASVVEEDFDRTILDIDHNAYDIKYKYCTEFIILNSDFDEDKLKEDLLDIGDSAVFAKSSKKFKTHIHTNNPGLAIEIAAKIGDLKNIKIENMKLQNEGVLENEKNTTKIFINKNQDKLSNIAYIAVADTDKLKDYYLELGANVVILGGQSQNPSVKDILDAISKLDDTKKHIYVLANNKNIISTAKLAGEKTERTVIVIPTKTMLEGIIYLKYNYTDIDKKDEMLKRASSIEITKAVRDTKNDGIEIKKDDYLLLVNTKIKNASSNLSELVDIIKNEYINDLSIALTIVVGANKNEKEIKALKSIDKLVQDTKIIDSDMANYDLYVLIENKDKNMKDIAIVTDSAADLSEKEIKEQDIVVIPIRLVDNDSISYKDGVNLSKEEFWNMLINENKTFKTAQPSPKEIVNVYLEQFMKGYKKVLVIPISSRLSGEHQVLKLAREISKKEKEVKIFDSKAVSLLQGYLVKEAVKKVNNNYEMDEIVEHLIKVRDRSKLYIMIDTLKYLQQGGRISKTSQKIGDFFNMKPIITMVDGTLSVEKKVLGGESSIIKYVERNVYDIYKNQSTYVVLAYGGTRGQLEFINKLGSQVSNYNRKASIIKPIVEIGPTVGTHAGPVSGVLVVPKLL
ncbi:DegV family protein [Oceanivirga miroungae]|uniref:DegV family protein n=1 Tax=Oceanivirga miroungae TaxID=1130046 RepID=A0A6I8M9X7_9FUSO|nr:DegV family protein [Oceanivirga miroungae]VWL85619.1 degV family protein [Oceanivirga miroungae]